MKQRNANSNLSRIRDELERRFIVMRYSKASIKKYMSVFGWMEDYLNGYGETNYTKELGQRFLVEYSLQSDHSPSQYKYARIIIRRTDEILENKLFQPCFRKEKSDCPVRFKGLYDKYLENLNRRGYKKSTIIGIKRYTELLLNRLPETILSLEELSATDLHNIFTKHEWPSAIFGIARRFISYLFENSVIKTNLSACVPSTCRPRSLPSVYSGDEVKRLLSSVDRASSLGKRDYAILLLAAYLGLRSSDIIGLSFDNINYASKTIKIIQVKTNRPLTLVMNSDVEEAIVDYIQNGRPQLSRTEKSHDKIFIGFKAPFSPLIPASCHNITRKYFNLAGIAAQGRRRGTHALRASYATALVARNVPYTVVQRALGHEDREAAKYYVRIDVRRLKMCALDVPKPTGAFAVMLEPNVRINLKGAL